MVSPSPQGGNTLEYLKLQSDLFDPVSPVKPPMVPGVTGGKRMLVSRRWERDLPWDGGSAPSSAKVYGAGHLQQQQQQLMFS